MEAANDITFRPAWQIGDPQIIGDAKRLWAQIGIPAQLTAHREKELCAAAYCNGEIAAVATAEIFYWSIMRHNFFAYRCLIAPKFRRQNLSWRITAYSFKLLHEWAQKNPDPRILGLMFVFETDKFAVPQRKPIRKNLGMTLYFAAYTPEGQQVRIVWFDDAELDDDPVKQHLSVRPPSR